MARRPSGRKSLANREELEKNDERRNGGKETRARARVRDETPWLSFVFQNTRRVIRGTTSDFRNFALDASDRPCRACRFKSRRSIRTLERKAFVALSSRPYSETEPHFLAGERGAVREAGGKASRDGDALDVASRRGRVMPYPLYLGCGFHSIFLTGHRGEGAVTGATIAATSRA